MRRPLLLIGALVLFCNMLLAAGGPAPQRVLRDITYTQTPAGRLLLNLYLPPRATAPVPVVIYIHGGDWMYGNRGDASGAFLTRYGMAVASIDYRLAPRNRFPAQAKDCRDALIFLHVNAAKYGLDPERIGILGESAGGHLAALTATAPDDPAFVGHYRDKAAPRVKALCAVSGPMDIAYLGTLGDVAEALIGTHPIQHLLGGPVSEKAELAALASPIRHVTRDDPPTLLIYGDEDYVVLPILALDMHAGLVAAGVASELYAVPGVGHDMRGMYRRTQDRIAGFFQRHLLGYPTTRPVDVP